MWEGGEGYVSVCSLSLQNEIDFVGGTALFTFSSPNDLCVCVCMCACVRARARVCVCECECEFEFECVYVCVCV